MLKLIAKATTATTAIAIIVVTIIVLPAELFPPVGPPLPPL
jgi:hypothetical protein